jgi:hypothetical protein
MTLFGYATHVAATTLAFALTLAALASGIRVDERPSQEPARATTIGPGSARNRMTARLGQLP